MDYTLMSSAVTELRKPQVNLELIFGQDFLMLAEPKTGITGQLVIAGYASVQVPDSETHIIDTFQLRKAFIPFMAKPEFRNIMIEHTSLQIGWVLDSFTSEDGRTYTSHVDDIGLFLVCQIRDEADLTIMKQVREEILDGRLRMFSIMGVAFKAAEQPYSNATSLDSLELFEVTICRQGKNPLSRFNVIHKSFSDLLHNLNDTVAAFSDRVVIVPEFVALAGDIVAKGESSSISVVLNAQEETTDPLLAYHVQQQLRGFLSPETEVLWQWDENFALQQHVLPLYDLVLVPSVARSPISFAKSEGSSRITQSYLLEQAEELLGVHFDLQQALVEMVLSKSYGSRKQLFKKLSAAINRGWGDLTKQFSSTVLQPSFELGRGVVKAYGDGDEMLTSLSDHTLLVKAAPTDTFEASSVIQYLSNKFDDVNDTTIRIVLNLAYNAIDADGQLDQSKAKIDVRDAFGRWKKHTGRIKTIASDQVGKTASAGTLYAFQTTGGTSVTVIDNEMPNSCLSCKAASGKVWSIGKAMTNLKEHPHCVRQFARSKE